MIFTSEWAKLIILHFFYSQTQFMPCLLRMGNKAFRDDDVETAVSLYSRAIDMVRDSPILYNNRALSYIKLSLYKRGLFIEESFCTINIGK